MEIKILTPPDSFLQNIEFNYDELKTQLQTNLEKYQNLVFTEETMREAKNTRASLNKLKKALDDKRKDIKKQCLAPYETFETKINDLIELVDKPTLAIDNQIKTYEDSLKTQKKQEIINYFNSQSPFGDLIKIDHPRFWDDKWLNTTKKIDEVKYEIDNKLESIERGLEAIDVNLQSEFKPQIRDIFLQTFDLTKALNENKRLELQKKAEEEYRQKQEETKQQPIDPQAKAIPENTTTENIKKWKTFSVEVTKEEFASIRRFLIDNNINYQFE